MTAALILCVLTTPTFPDEPGPAPQPSSLQFEWPRSQAVFDETPRYEGATRYSYMWTYKKDNEITPFHDALLDKLSSANIIPVQRLQRFASYNKQPYLRDGVVRWSRLVRWGAAVVSVDRRVGGWLVKVQIEPKVATDKGDQHRYVDFYFEKFFVSVAGDISFVGWEEGSGGLISIVH